jgi:hypothetical protein
MPKKKKTTKTFLKVMADTRKEMAKTRTVKSARKREDVNQAAARIVRQATRD